MHKIILLVLLSLFSISSAKNSVKLEILKMKADARYQKEMQRCESEAIKLCLALAVGGSAAAFFVFTMGKGGLIETEFMQQMIGNFRMGLYALSGFGAIELGIGMYMTIKA